MLPLSPESGSYFAAYDTLRSTGPGKTYVNTVLAGFAQERHMPSSVAGHGEEPVRHCLLALENPPAAKACVLSQKFLAMRSAHLHEESDEGKEEE